MNSDSFQVVIDEAVEEIRALIGDRLSTNISIKENHSHDESWHVPGMPDAVCFVESIDEVVAITKVCSQRNIPLIPFGAGTGVVGQINAINGGISLDLSGMNQILEVNTDDFDCTVQAGVTREELNEYIRDTGLFFSVDPGANATLGGMAATRAAGTTTVRYGTMVENVINVKAVLPDGQVVKTASRAKKSSAGYDLTHLFVGSEGTLGTIVEVTLKLNGRPASTSVAIAQFENIENAVDTVIASMAYNIQVTRIELVDEILIKAINDYSKTDFTLKPSLFIEFQGSELGVKEELEAFKEICEENLHQGFSVITAESEQQAIWKSRHNAAYAFLNTRPGAKNFSTDVCVPISKLAQCISESVADAEQSLDIPFLVAGHVGDGNFHIAMPIDPEQEDELVRANAFYDRLAMRAIDMDGTCTGEHGVGLQKAKYLPHEFGESGVDLMWTIKKAIDPKNTMNPGKKLP